MSIDAMRTASLAGDEPCPDEDAVEFRGANTPPPPRQPLQLIHTVKVPVAVWYRKRNQAFAARTYC